MAIIKFVRGEFEGYKPSAEHKDAIFFATDQKAIYVNNVKYGFNPSEESIIGDITYANGKLTITYTDDTPSKDLDINDLKMYESAMPNELTVPTTIGGLKAGTTAADLKEKTVSQVLDDIIFPELNPTVVAPSASISFASGFNANGIYEVGATAPTATNFNTSFNRGSGKVAGKADLYRAGALQAESSFIYYGGQTSVTILPLTITLGAMQYNYHAAYAQGDTLVTSKNNTATHDAEGTSITNPLPAGSVNSGNLVIYGTYPYFCNGASASSSNQDANLPESVTPNTKLPLVTWTTTLIGAKFASEAATGTRLVFEYPSTKKITKVEFMNTVSGKWENFTAYTTASAGNKLIQGSDIAYTSLTTTGSLSGALQLRFTVANV